MTLNDAEARAAEISFFHGGDSCYYEDAIQNGSKYILTIKESGSPCGMGNSRKDLLRDLENPDSFEILSVKQFKKTHHLK